MKKLALNLDELHVESFDTSSGEPDGRGTIQGRAADTENTPDTCDVTCPNNNTCDITCPNTCLNTCQDSCYGTCGAACTWGYTCPPTCADTCQCTKIVGQYGCTYDGCNPTWRC